MTRTVLWSSSAGDIPANLAFTNNFAATVDPTVSNDHTQGYTPGSQWINQTDGKAFLMISNATGAAVWQGDSQQVGEVQQGAPAVLNATGTLTPANALSGIITSTAAAAVAATLPLAADLDTALPKYGANDAFDFSVINTGGAAAVTMTTNTGWTLVGSMVVALGTSARFRARKTAAGAWTLYRLS